LRTFYAGTALVKFEKHSRVFAPFFDIFVDKKRLLVYNQIT